MFEEMTAELGQINHKLAVGVMFLLEHVFVQRQVAKYSL